MHNACFFSSKHVLPYTNGTTRVVRVLSHCPYGLLANTYIPIEKTCETHTKTKQKFGIKSENSNLVRKTGVSILTSYGENPHYVKLPNFSEFMENSTKFMKNSDLTKS